MTKFSAFRLSHLTLRDIATMPAAHAVLPVMARGHAGEKVSDLPELLEMILLHLDYEGLARDAYHVNSAFRNCILGSPEIRQRMFLSPSFSPSFGPPGSSPILHCRYV